jgi:hypothetical protein
LPTSLPFISTRRSGDSDLRKHQLSALQGDSVCNSVWLSKFETKKPVSSKAAAQWSADVLRLHRGCGQASIVVGTIGFNLRFRFRLIGSMLSLDAIERLGGVLCVFHGLVPRSCPVLLRDLEAGVMARRLRKQVRERERAKEASDEAVSALHSKLVSWQNKYSPPRCLEPASSNRRHALATDLLKPRTPTPLNRA